MDLRQVSRQPSHDGEATGKIARRPHFGRDVVARGLGSGRGRRIPNPDEDLALCARHRRQCVDSCVVDPIRDHAPDRKFAGGRRQRELGPPLDRDRRDEHNDADDDQEGERLEDSTSGSQRRDRHHDRDDRPGDGRHEYVRDGASCGQRPHGVSAVDHKRRGRDEHRHTVERHSRGARPGHEAIEYRQDRVRRQHPGRHDEKQEPWRALTRVQQETDRADDAGERGEPGRGAQARPGVHQNPK